MSNVGSGIRQPMNVMFERGTQSLALIDSMEAQASQYDGM